ncbi:MAG: pentapeptide repeat-containing protein [Gammaproteobacteria bacterium]|nr:pentapeptide repeat-containing protein [Gammaproteobacteria bacterium]
MNKSKVWLTVVITVSLALIILGLFFIEPDPKIELKDLIFGGVGLIGGIVGLFLFEKRNNAMLRNTKVLEENQIKESHFMHFNSATKMLTDKDATLESKISALYLLYDVGKAFDESLGRVLQVINQSLKPFKKNIDYQMDYEDNPESITLSSDLVMDVVLKEPDYKRKINEWVIKGSDIQQLVISALQIQKKIFQRQLVLGSLDEADMSNCIFFDIDSSFCEVKKLSLNNPQKNIVFLGCDLTGFDFSSNRLHIATFIDCDLTKCDFKRADLWGSIFFNCRLKETDFSGSYLGHVVFRGCSDFREDDFKDLDVPDSQDQEYNAPYFDTIKNGYTEFQ